MGGESPIFSKTFDLLLWISSHTEKFPKNERFRLARRIEDSAFHMHSMLLRAAYQKRLGKGIEGTAPSAALSYLQEADIALKQLQFYFRITHHKQLSTTRQYVFISEMLLEIGKLIGAWIKTV